MLCSGGLDSVVLLASVACEERVLPIYVSAGLAWEAEERAALGRILEARPFVSRVAPLATLELTARDLYPPGHWAIEGRPPAYDTDDSEVYLPGRNLLLLAKAAVFCAASSIHRLLIGPLAGNPFPDATPAFFAAMARASSLGLAFDLRIDAPFLGMHKSEVMRMGERLGVRLEMTVSCMAPEPGGVHCGRCSKCRERRDAFKEAGVADRTVYQSTAPR